ncbi:NAD(P)-dependent oxidoreductase [Bacillus sp. B15-48]|uniref:NAD-dependent epimerase/dehydratase family protein n=1 Tax=Bacillus sp. B15-48 TaxID=1548601 RepID=UPI00193F2766|nr:NAD(P)-dependent oxidoreductase [Bacillus sp. B15-48]
MSNKTVLVSGASGFLGKELISQLLEVRYPTIALTSKPKELREAFRQNTDLTVLNINDWTNRVDDDQNIDVLINCAFPRNSDPEQLAAGLDFTERLVNNAIKTGIMNIINISSQSVYSQKNKSTPDEQTTVAPESLYGLAKYSSEKIVTLISKNSKVNFSNIRLASLTGFDLESRMTNKFVKLAIKGGKVTIDGTGQKVSYLDVKDAVSALILMMNQDSENWRQTYNLGNYHFKSVLEIAETVNDIAERYLLPGLQIELKDGLSDFNNLINSEAFYSDFGWRPKYDIPLMVDELFGYYKNLV